MSETRTRIKICGITNRDDALAAVECGASALGFIFVPGTPRFVGENADLGALTRDLPPFIARVGVCLQPLQISPAQTEDLTTIQFYEGDGAVAAQTARELVRVFRLTDISSIDQIDSYLRLGRASALHLDTYHAEKLGGSGETFNWELAVEVKRRFGLPIILAGGLTADNVEEAILRVRPYAVDVSSGVEAAPGRKDHTELRRFARAVRRADARIELD